VKKFGVLQSGTLYICFGFAEMNFMRFLKYMGIGMIGVFIIIGIIMIATYAIGKLTAKKEEKDN